jgi:hypothetical protein
MYSSFLYVKILLLNLNKHILRTIFGLLKTRIRIKTYGRDNTNAQNERYHGRRGYRTMVKKSREMK